MKQYINKFFKDEEGSVILEYAAIIGIVAALLIGALVLVSNVINNKMVSAAKEVNNAGAGNSQDIGAANAALDQQTKALTTSGAAGN